MFVQRMQLARWVGRFNSRTSFTLAHKNHLATLVDRECMPRSNAFYSEEAVQRHYFYFVDTRGLVFLEETMPRNIATCLKDTKFLDFTLRNMKLNSGSTSTGIHPNIPYYSLCGKEINFISPADVFCSLVFKDVDWNASLLTYAGTLQQSFRPDLLLYNPDSGRIYHKVTAHRFLSGTYGLLHPHICQHIGDFITTSAAADGSDPMDTPCRWDDATSELESTVTGSTISRETDCNSSESSSGRYYLHWQGEIYSLGAVQES